MSKPVLAAIAFIVLVVGALVYSTMGLKQFTCEVCMDFKVERTAPLHREPPKKKPSERRRTQLAQRFRRA